MTPATSRNIQKVDDIIRGVRWVIADKGREVMRHNSSVTFCIHEFNHTKLSLMKENCQIQS